MSEGCGCRQSPWIPRRATWARNCLVGRACPLNPSSRSAERDATVVDVATVTTARALLGSANPAWSCRSRRLGHACGSCGSHVNASCTCSLRLRRRASSSCLHGDVRTPCGSTGTGSGRAGATSGSAAIGRRNAAAIGTSRRIGRCAAPSGHSSRRRGSSSANDATRAGQARMIDTPPSAKSAVPVVKLEASLAR